VAVEAKRKSRIFAAVTAALQYRSKLCSCLPSADGNTNRPRTLRWKCPQLTEPHTAVQRDCDHRLHQAGIAPARRARVSGPSYRTGSDAAGLSYSGHLSLPPITFPNSVIGGTFSLHSRFPLIVLTVNAPPPRFFSALALPPIVPPVATRVPMFPSY
jgi:hypothetical protein